MKKQQIIFLQQLHVLLFLKTVYRMKSRSNVIYHREGRVNVAWFTSRCFTSFSLNDDVSSCRLRLCLAHVASLRPMSVENNPMWPADSRDVTLSFFVATHLNSVITHNKGNVLTSGLLQDFKLAFAISSYAVTTGPWFTSLTREKVLINKHSYAKLWLYHNIDKKGKKSLSP